MPLKTESQKPNIKKQKPKEHLTESQTLQIWQILYPVSILPPILGRRAQV